MEERLGANRGCGMDELLCVSFLSDCMFSLFTAHLDLEFLEEEILCLNGTFLVK